MWGEHLGVRQVGVWVTAWWKEGMLGVRARMEVV